MSKDFEQIESSQRQANEEKVSYEKLCGVYEQRVISTFKNTGAALKKDGDKWCVLLGGDVQSGVCGFGVKPYDAMVKFFEAMGLN